MEDTKGVSLSAVESRRQVIRKLAYAAPIVVSLAAAPAFASSGSAGSSSGGEGSCQRGSKPHTSGGEQAINN